MATETELKLCAGAIDFDFLDRVDPVRRYARGPARDRQLTSVYFDTTDLALRDRDVAIRLREVDGRWIQTVKARDRASAGLHRRAEWEHEVQGDTLEPERVASPAVRELLATEPIRSGLHPVFTTEFRRKTWDLVFPDGTEIELAADRGTIRAGDVATPISEIELELRNGRLSHVYELATALNDIVPLKLSSVSKAARGYELVKPNGVPQPVFATGLRFDGNESLETTFIAIATDAIGQLHGNEPAILENSVDVEGVHQMRVAARRTRALFSFFRPWIPRIATRALEAELRWLGGLLGPARDWDVFLEETLQPLIDDLPDEDTLLDVRRAAERQRRAAYEAAETGLRSQRYTRLVLQLSAWIESRGWRTDPDADLQTLLGPAAPAVAARLRKMHRRVAKLGKGLDERTDEERHRVRITLKKLRYAVRAYESLFSKKVARRYRRRVARLQDSLGVLNDQAVTASLLKRLAADAPPVGIAILRGATARAARLGLASLESEWREFRDTPRPWA